MNQTPPAEPAARATFRVTTGQTPHEPQVRPWELELLISGAVTFALLQLPGRLDAWFQLLAPRLDQGMGVASLVVYYYGKVILYVLIGGFSTHLAARAYWVGLIGLESVFPDGVKWEGTRYGPAMREVYESRLARLQPLIDRADRFCSIIFPAAFSMVAVFLYSIVSVAVAGGLALGVSRLVFGGRYAAVLYFVMLAAWAGFSSGVTLLDRGPGSRWEAAGRGGRFLRRAALMLYYASGMPIFGVVWMVLFSNLPRRVFLSGIWLGVGGLLLFAIVKDILLREGSAGLDGYHYLPAKPADAVEAVHYESLRRGEPPADPPVPSIQSDVVTGPYVRLFIPYAPRRLNPAIAENCPRVSRPRRGMLIISPPVDSGGRAQQAALLACWAGLQPVRLNGAPIRPAFRLHRQPGTGLQGMLAYIPTRNLPAGENVLEIANPPRPRDQRRPPRPPYLIPFWR